MSVDDLYSMMKAYFYNKHAPSHSEIKAMATSLVLGLRNNSADDEDTINEIVARYEENIGIKAFEPDMLYGANKNEDWFYEKKPNVNYSDSYFKRYEDYLVAEDFPKEVIDNIKLNSERVLSLSANPENIHDALNQKRKGLVVGDVQSGKTANYLGLINLACDYGYKTIVILAGMTDSLRQQTQQRVDEGFIGAKSNTITNVETEYIGVGSSSRKHYAVPLTNHDFDFAKFVRENSTAPDDYNKPVILVVKKNKSILTQVKKLLKPGQFNDFKNLLIIDDEADNASVNTKNPDQDPSAINSLIRDIFFNYENATYIGFTATPFANIFINPDDENSQKDLFPSDFIIQLNTPDNYFGGGKVFDGSSRVIREIEESEPNFLPVKHKKDYEYLGISHSIKEAIWSFLINNVIRTLRGHEKKHRSMMINISSLNDIQEKIRFNVQSYVDKIKDVIEQTSHYRLEKFVRNDDMKEMYELYNSSFYDKIRSEIEWDIIQSKLYSEISKFSVVVVNNRNKKKDRFSYEDYNDYGARVIAIGGFVLSRGLTLEGLMVSYYSRNSSTYDTMLQMCRWFGYRPKYEDLCRVYISGINIDNFRAVIDATNDLKIQFREMQALGKTPEEYSVMVKESPDTLETTLLITSRNKQKNTMSIERALNYGGSPVDTSKLYLDKDANLHNYKNVLNLINGLEESGKSIKLVNNRYLIRDVPNKYIAEIIAQLKLPIENKKFDKDSLNGYILSNDRFDNWDIVIATGNKNNSTIRLGSFDIPKPKRTFHLRDGEDYIRISGNNNRLVEPGIFNAGLTETQIEKVNMKLKSENKKNPTREFLSVEGRNPLFIIYPLIINASDESDKTQVDLENTYNEENNHMIGFGIGFPSYGEKVIIKYRVNSKLYIKIKEEIDREYMEEFDSDEF